jgi:membrane protease YdiL (CAAX protease family)
LTLLADSPDPLTVTLICITAAIMAPLSEEMMFRVVLQGALTRFSQPRIAIPVTAVAFAAIHGPIDGIALVPLALILGYVFDRRHSYVSVLVIHGLFNATMLTLALLTQA